MPRGPPPPTSIRSPGRAGRPRSGRLLDEPGVVGPGEEGVTAGGWDASVSPPPLPAAPGLSFPGRTGRRARLSRLGYHCAASCCPLLAAGPNVGRAGTSGRLPGPPAWGPVSCWRLQWDSRIAPRLAKSSVEELYESLCVCLCVQTHRGLVLEAPSQSGSPGSIPKALRSADTGGYLPPPAPSSSPTPLLPNGFAAPDILNKVVARVWLQGSLICLLEVEGVLLLGKGFWYSMSVETCQCPKEELSRIRVPWEPQVGLRAP